MERHVQMSWMYLKRHNRKLKWEHAVKFRNIGMLITSLILIITKGMLHLISIVLMRGIQLKKNFSNLSYPVLTTTQNDDKLHIFDSNSLVILSIWPYYAWRDIVQMSWMYLKRSNRKLKWEHAVKLRNIGLLITSLILIITIGMLHIISIVLMRGIQLKKNFSNLSYPVLITSHNYSKWWQITHFWFQFFSYPFYMAILCMERHIQMSWMYLKRSNRKLKWEHAVKLRNIGLLITSLILIIRIGMLHLILILMRGFQLKKNFSNLSYPVLTTTQNDDKLYILDSNSLVILSIWP